MRDIPTSYVDAKKFFDKKDPYPGVYSQFLTRYSSPYRMLATTIGGGLGGGFFGISWAIYHNQSKSKYFLRCGAGALGFSLFYAFFNELMNGVVKRKFGKEKLFLSNTASAILTMGLVHAFQSALGMPARPSLRRAFKYVGSLCVANMYLEILLIQQRDFFLERQQVFKRPELTLSFEQKEEGSRTRTFNRLGRNQEVVASTEKPAQIETEKKA